VSNTPLTPHQARLGTKKGLWLICINYNYRQAPHSDREGNLGKQSYPIYKCSGYCRVGHVRKRTATLYHHKINSGPPSHFLCITIAQKCFLPSERVCLACLTTQERHPPDVKAGGPLHYLQHGNGGRKWGKKYLYSTALTCISNLHGQLLLYKISKPI